MQVIDALRRHDCSEALAWCAEQRPRLKKAKSKLEFELRVQVCDLRCALASHLAAPGNSQHTLRSNFVRPSITL